MSIEIAEFHVSEASESSLEELYTLELEIDREMLPDDPPEPFESKVARWSHVPGHQIVRRWAAWENGQIVASAFLSMDRHQDLNNGFARIYVPPESRRQGLARMLASPLCEALEEEGRSLVIVDTVDGSPWEEKLLSLGFRRGIRERMSRLVAAELDQDLTERWIGAATDRAEGYELLQLTTPIDEDYLERWCALQDVMNTAPRENLTMDDSTMTPGRWREIEETDERRGNELMACVAVETETGDFVGLSEILFRRLQPELAWQGDTGVDPGHRNRGLGRWLKAAMTQWFLEVHPEVEMIDTWNADSNEPMLKINVEMGYRPVLIVNVWQADLATIRPSVCTGAD